MTGSAKQSTPQHAEKWSASGLVDLVFLVITLPVTDDEKPVRYAGLESKPK